MNSNFFHESNNCTNSHTTYNSNREMVVPQGESSDNPYNSSDEESDVYEVPMSSPDSVSYTCTFL